MKPLNDAAKELANMDLAEYEARALTALSGLAQRSSNCLPGLHATHSRLCATRADHMLSSSHVYNLSRALLNGEAEAQLSPALAKLVDALRLMAALPEDFFQPKERQALRQAVSAALTKILDQHHSDCTELARCLGWAMPDTLIFLSRASSMQLLQYVSCDSIDAQLMSSAQRLYENRRSLRAQGEHDLPLAMEYAL